MVTISRRLRIFTSPEQDSLDQVRRRTREILNRPYTFEPKSAIPSWESMGADPLEGYFKPFSQVTATTLDQSAVITRSTLVSARRMVIAGSIILLALTIYLAYELFANVYSVHGVVSPLPATSLTPSFPQPAAIVSTIPVGASLSPNNNLPTLGIAPANDLISTSSNFLKSGVTSLTRASQPILQLSDNLLKKLPNPLKI